MDGLLYIFLIEWTGLLDGIGRWLTASRFFSPSRF